MARRYLAALEVLGEKTEEAEELRDDLEEVKVCERPSSVARRTTAGD